MAYKGFMWPVATGKTQTLAEWMPQYCRQYGFAIEQRDDPMDAGIKKSVVSQYEIDSVARDLKELQDAQSMTVAQAVNDYRSGLRKRDQQALDGLAKAKEEKARIQSMLDQTVAWDCAAILGEIKKNAIEELKEALKSAQDSVSYYEKELDEIEKKLLEEPDGKKLLQEKIDFAQKSYDRSVESLEEAKKRTDERNEYITGLYESLPAD